MKFNTYFESIWHTFLVLDSLKCIQKAFSASGSLECIQKAFSALGSLESIQQAFSVSCSFLATTVDFLYKAPYLCHWSKSQRA